MRNLLTRRQESDPVADGTAGERVVDRHAAQEEPTSTRRTPAFLNRRTATEAAARDEVTTERFRTGGTAVRERAVDERPATDEPTEVVEQPRWAHVSGMATLGLILGVVALALTLTGVLAVEGVAVGVIGGAVAAGGLVGASRRGVTGHSLAILGLVTSLGAILLGVLAIGGQLSWLDSKTDEVARVHDWILAQLPWLKRW